jgi:DNA repair protein RadD
MVELRPHQILLDQNIDEAKKAGAQNVLAVSPTGSGKTVLFIHRVRKHNTQCALVAHRSELLGQISSTLTRFYVPHRIVAPPPIIKEIARSQMIRFKRTSYDPNAKCAVVSIQSLVANAERFAMWGSGIAEWITDEGHHVLEKNTWGTGLKIFPNAQGELYTAHSGRGDGKGLGRHAHGIVDALVEGPLMRDLINAGFLVDYKIFCPPSDFDRGALGLTDKGEFKPSDVKKETRKSQVLGDVVNSYLRIARGKKGITFASDIEDAEEIAAKFRAAGIPAAAVSSKTPMNERIKYIEQFEAPNGLLQLVNVDLFGEGYDVPALEVVSFARPTASFQTYLQQFGRVLRTCVERGKQWGIVIDHVGNVVEHGLPDAYRVQTLDNRPRSSRGSVDPDVPPIKKCLSPTCFRAYEAIHPVCPYCGWKPEIKDRSRIEHVDGEIGELDPEVLRLLRGTVEQHLAYPNLPSNPLHAAALRNRHAEKVAAIQILKESMMWWAGWQQHRGLTHAQCQRAFYYRFGIDVMSAQMLDKNDAAMLHHKIQDHIKQIAGVKV